MMRLPLLATVFIVLTSLDVWLQPDRFHYHYGDEITVTHIFKIDFPEADTPFHSFSLQTSSIYFGGENDVVDDIWNKPNNDSLQIPVYHQGTIMFTSLLRSAISRADSQWKRYEYSMKTLLQMDQKFDETYKMRTRLPVDLVLQQHPYSFYSSISAKVKLYLNSEPAPFYEIEIKHVTVNGVESAERITTNAFGDAGFQLTPTGTWRLSAETKKEVIEEGKQIDLIQTGSCTWGYR